MQGTNRGGGGGKSREKSQLCDMWPRIWVTTRREIKKKGEDNKWDEQKKEKKNLVQDVYYTNTGPTQEISAKSSDSTDPTRQHELDHTDHTDHTDQKYTYLPWRI